ncbi:hypothetical protein DXG01_011156, partial [Tephrocybe rancida]
GPADKATGEGDKRGVDVGDKGSASRTSGHNSEGGDQPDRSEDEPEIDEEREPDGEQGKVQSDTQGSGGGEGTATPRTPENSNPLDASPATPADGGRGADNGQSGTGAEQDSSSDDEEKEEDKPNAPHNTPADERQEGGMDVDEESADEGPGKGSDEDDDEEEEEDKPSAPHDSSADEVQGGGMDVDGESADEGGGRGPAATGKDKGGGDGGECPFSVLAHKPEKPRRTFERQGVRFRKLNTNSFEQTTKIFLDRDHITPLQSQYFPLKVLTAAKASDTGIQFSSKSAFVVYGATEQSNPPYIPRGHARFQIISIERNMEMLQANYQNMLPKHIVNEDESVFKIVTRDTYCGMMSKAITDMLVTHNVVITSNTHENLAFDEDTLLRIAPLDRPIGVHDLSEPALIQGQAMTLRQLLEVVRSSHPKAINALELPLSEDPMPQEKFTSDIFAHKDVCGEEFFSKDQN